jgi:hypothetical protein
MSKVSRAIELFKEFGVGVMMAKLLQTCTRKVPGIRFSTGKLKYNAITDFLYSENKQNIDCFNSAIHKTTPNIGKNSNVWSLWWQGEDNAPEVVKICFESIRNNIGERKLIVLNQYNYSSYVQLNKKYVDMLSTEIITRTQFSDLLRLNLLYQQGGIWLDSTYLLTDVLEEYISDLSFFSIRHGMEKEYPMSKGLWTSSALGFGKGSEELKLFIEVYDEYFRRHDRLVDYLLTDYVFAVCCDNCIEVKKMFESVPVNNQNVNQLLLSMNHKYEERIVSRVTKGTTMNKLSWKRSYIDTMKNKNTGLASEGKTIYGYYKNKYLRMK